MSGAGDLGAAWAKLEKVEIRLDAALRHLAQRDATIAAVRALIEPGAGRMLEVDGDRYIHETDLRRALDGGDQ